MINTNLLSLPFQQTDKQVSLNKYAMTFPGSPLANDVFEFHNVRFGQINEEEEDTFNEEVKREEISTEKENPQPTREELIETEIIRRNAPTTTTQVEGNYK